MPKNVFEKFELASERGQWQEALAIVDRLTVRAALRNDVKLLLNALAHRCHVFKHFWQQSANNLFLDLFRDDIQAGLNIAVRRRVSGQPLAVLQLRLGDYFDYTGDRKRAEQWYRKAIVTLGAAALPGERGEYQGHYFLALYKNGKVGRARTAAEQAFANVSRDRTLRPWHRLILLSGLHMRRAQGEISTGRRAAAVPDLAAARSLASELKRTYGMGMRMVQLGMLKKQLNFKQ
ncbi:MAG TPA: hypothetical protein VHA30_01440 [Patescibacteria group bacterium]|nr:hypothetical protein [Patescibacteria group bacterium]